MKLVYFKFSFLLLSFHFVACVLLRFNVDLFIQGYVFSIEIELVLIGATCFKMDEHSLLKDWIRVFTSFPIECRELSNMTENLSAVVSVEC